MKRNTPKTMIRLLGCLSIISFLLIPEYIYCMEKIDQGFIYGQVNLKDGSQVQGPMRWGKEEAYWHDFFNSTKEDNDNSIYLSRRDRRELRRKKSGTGFGGFLRRLFTNFDGNSIILPTHQFVCRFGDIKEMQLRGSNIVLMRLKNGERIEVKGGSNDIGTEIHIIDQRLGKIALKWNRIRNIEFMPTPQPLTQRFGLPLYGTVTTKYENFKGYIQWDHQECLDTDLLDGKTKNGDISIEFAKIKSIEKFKRGALVTFHEGEELYVYGSNDVNDDNRGIIINDPNIGKIHVEWDEFDRIDFEKTPAKPPIQYNDYALPKALAGKIYTKDERTYEGKIVYDLDEDMDFEIISGKHNNIKYNIPLRNISWIIPLGSCCSKIVLKNGATIELEEDRDVSNDNDGILVWGDSKEADYISWRRIKKINFN